MAATRITALPAAPSLDYNNDVFPIVDVSATTPITPTGTTSKATLSQVDAVLIASGNKSIVVDNVAALRAVSVSSIVDGQIYVTRGYSTDNDGGQGTYIYTSSSSDADNSGTVIAPTSGSGRFLLQYSGQLNVKQCGGSITTAVACLPNGGKIFLPSGTYSSPGTVTASNLSFIGEKRPDFNVGFTALQGGTIIQGPFVFRGNNLEFSNLGVDSGSAVCNSVYSGVAQEGLVCTVNYLAGQPQFVDLTVNNVCALAKDPSSAVHAFSVEGYSNVNISNVDTVYGTHGQAYKVLGGLVSDFRSRYSAGEGVIIKSDPTRQCKRTVFSNFQIDGENASNTYGLVLQNYFGSPGNYLEINDLVISDGYIRNCGTGFMLQGNATPATDLTRDIAISNIICSNNSYLGFRLYGNSKRITFVNCHSITTYATGWSIEPGSSFIRLCSCTSSNSGSTGGVNYGNGIDIQGTDVDLDGFTTFDNNGFGVYIKSGSTSYFSGLRGYGNVFPGNETDLIYRDANVFPSSRDLPVQFTNLTLTAPWVNLGGNGPAQILKGIDNVVYLRGTVQNTTTGAVIATIPVNYRPAAPNYLRWNATCYNAGSVDNPAILQLDPTTGQLSVIGSRGIGAGNWIQIDYRWPAYR
jgi:hypothetical protein